jgi:S1-C subfamily serine protease
MDEEIAESLGLDEPKGALVAEVVPDGPADEARVRAGDVITDFGGDEVWKVKDLTRLAAGAEPGSRLGVRVWREGETVELNLEMGSSSKDSPEAEAPRVAAKGKLGLSLAPLTDADRQRHGLDDEVEGAVVAGVAPNCLAARKGLRARSSPEGSRRPATSWRRPTRAKKGSSWPSRGNTTSWSSTGCSREWMASPSWSRPGAPAAEPPSWS